MPDQRQRFRRSPSELGEEQGIHQLAVGNSRPWAWERETSWRASFRGEKSACRSCRWARPAWRLCHILLFFVPAGHGSALSFELFCHRRLPVDVGPRRAGCTTCRCRRICNITARKKPAAPYFAAMNFMTFCRHAGGFGACIFCWSACWASRRARFSCWLGSVVAAAGRGADQAHGLRHHAAVGGGLVAADVPDADRGPGKHSGRRGADYAQSRELRRRVAGGSGLPARPADAGFRRLFRDSLAALVRADGAGDPHSSRAEIDNPIAAHRPRGPARAANWFACFPRAASPAPAKCSRSSRA